MLRIWLFGAPRIELQGAVVPLRRTKALALLAYLALVRQPQQRDGLAALLWPEFDDTSARNNLRRELSLLKGLLGEETLTADRLQVGVSPRANFWLDVSAFEEQVAEPKRHGHTPGELCAACASALALGAQLYGDDLLAGFAAPDAPSFDEWLFFRREELRQQLAETLRALVEWHSRQGAYDATLGFARRWLALDPLHEPAQRELMRLYALAGQRSAALRQYEESERLLAAELGVEPEPATRELYEEIRSRRLGPPAAIPEPPQQPRGDALAPSAEADAARRAPFGSLPPNAGFVGRQRELGDIIRRLTDPSCRLLTLTGQGGVGKTRLAIRAAQTIAEGWAGEEVLADGVLFVPLAAVSSRDGLISALAAAARFDFYPSATPRQQIVDYLRDKRMLLVLDNFEQLTDSAAFLSALLAEAPGVRLLVTSRVALNLPEEWFHPIEGLSFPVEDASGDGVAQLARFDAVRLFEQHARRVRIDFALAREREQVVRLCRMVEGMPLALELAAGWLTVLSVDQIVGALAQNLDILTARDRVISERHRSMRTVLEETWRLLVAEQRRALAWLSVFPGGFSAAVAEGIGGVSLGALATLVERSLLRLAADGRFQLHGLLRQFAAEQLAADPQLARQAHASHSAYYLAFLAEREGRLRGQEYRAASAEIAAEVENVRAAWRWAAQQGDDAALDRALAGCFVYFLTSSQFQEGAALFDLAIGERDGGTGPLEGVALRLRARALIHRGVFRYFLGDYDAAVPDIERGLDLAGERGCESDVGRGYTVLGAIAGWRGDDQAARLNLGRALAIGRETGDQQLIADALHEQSRICGSYGEYALGRSLAEQSLAIGRAVGQPDWTGHALLTLAWATLCLGDYAEAERCFRESLEQFERSGSAYGRSMALSGIGWVAWCVGGARLPEARGSIEASLALAQALGHRLSVANNLGDLALVAIDEGDEQLAQEYGQSGLALARELDSAIYIVYHLCILGHVASARREFALSRRLLQEALRVALGARLWPKIAFALYHVAVLLVREAGATEPGRSHSPRVARAIELLAAIVEHPASWDVCRARARDLIGELRRVLPAAVVEEALARGRRFDWGAGVVALIEELAPASDAGGAEGASIAPAALAGVYRSVLELQAQREGASASAT
jgi:DNA-binding SARP family transcriptional activator/predicted ATPase